MEQKGRIKEVLPMQSGTGRNGEWHKQQIVITTSGDYPKDIILTAWKDVAKYAATLKVGQYITAQIELESKKNDKGYWNTDVRTWKIEASPATASASQSVADETFATTQDDDLPF